jgi:hypothetical protein
MAYINPYIDDDDDDIKIPSEFLVKPHAATSTAASSIIQQQQQQQQQQEYINLLQKPLPVNDPVKYNNTVRERHSYYTTKGVDRYWDEEFGDGFDPMMFVEESCRGGTIAASKPDDDDYHDDANGMMKGGAVKNDGLAEQQSNCEPEQEANVESTLLAENYTTSLLQRCWDRAVHAASSSIILPPTDITGRQQVKLDKTMPICEEKDVSSGLESYEVARSALQSEATNVVDSVLDALLDNDDGCLNRKVMTNENIGTIDWRHVFRSLRNVTEKSTLSSGHDASDNEMNHVTMKALSMRLIERYYSNASPKMPPSKSLG